MVMPTFILHTNGTDKTPENGLNLTKRNQRLGEVRPKNSLLPVID
jgi:hypothetical protein